MANVSAFLAELGSMAGVSGYLLIGDNGQPLAKTIPDADQVSAMLQVVLLSTGKIQDALGVARLHHMTFSAAGGGSLLVLPLGRFLLGVEQTESEPGVDLAEEIRALVKRH